MWLMEVIYQPQGRALFVLYTTGGMAPFEATLPLSPHLRSTSRALYRSHGPHLATHGVAAWPTSPRLGPALGLMRPNEKNGRIGFHRRQSFLVKIPTLSGWPYVATSDLRLWKICDAWPAAARFAEHRIPLYPHTWPCARLSWAPNSAVQPYDREPQASGTSEPRRYKNSGCPSFTSAPSSTFARERVSPSSSTEHTTTTQPLLILYRSWSLSTDANSCVARSAYFAITTIVVLPKYSVGEPPHSVARAPSSTRTSRSLSPK